MENRYLCDTARHAEPASVLRALALLLVCAGATAADGPAHRWDCGPAPVVTPSPLEGRLLILPGVGNTRFHLAGFVAAAEAELPRFDSRCARGACRS